MSVKKIDGVIPTTVKEMILAALLKKMKVKPKSMKGGASCVDYIACQKKKTLEPSHRKQLISLLNKFVRVNTKSQVGSGSVADWFTKTFTPSPATKRFFKSFGDGFVKGFTGSAKVLGPILDAISIIQPELAPIAAGVGVVNRLAN